MYVCSWVTDMSSHFPCEQFPINDESDPDTSLVGEMWLPVMYVCSYVGVCRVICCMHRSDLKLKFSYLQAWRRLLWMLVDKWFQSRTA